MSKGKTHTWKWETWSSTAIWLKVLFSFLCCLILFQMKKYLFHPCLRWSQAAWLHTAFRTALDCTTAWLVCSQHPDLEELLYDSKWSTGPIERVPVTTAGWIGDLRQEAHIYVLQLSWNLQQRQSFSEGESLEHHIGPFSLPLAFSLCNYVCSLRVDHFSTCDHTTQSVPWYILFLLLGLYPVTGTHSTLLQTAITCWNKKKKKKSISGK